MFQGNIFHTDNNMIRFHLTENNEYNYSIYYTPSEITVYTNTIKTIFIISATSQSLNISDDNTFYRQWYACFAKNGRVSKLCTEIHNPSNTEHWKNIHQIIHNCFSKDIHKKEICTILQDKNYNITNNTHIIYPSVYHILFKKDIIDLSRSYDKKGKYSFYLYRNISFETFSEHKRIQKTKKIIDTILKAPLYSRDYEL